MCCVWDCKTIKQIQERTLSWVLYDFNKTYFNLLNTASKRTLYRIILSCLAIEIYKTLNEMSPLNMKDIFIQTEVTYGLWDVNLLVQPLKQSLIA